jgi:hypothetical protein
LLIFEKEINLHWRTRLTQAEEKRKRGLADEYVQLSGFLHMNTAERRFSLRKAGGPKLLGRKGQNVSL